MVDAFHLQKNRDPLLNLDTLEFFCHDLVESRPAIGTFLFNQRKHLLLQSKKGWRVYGLRHQKTKRVAAQIFIHIKGKEAHSPWRAPFGSLELFQEIELKEINDLWIQVEKDLIKRGVRYLQIKNYPMAYHPMAACAVQESLINLNFKTIEEVSCIIPVDDKLLLTKLAVSQRQNLRKSEKLFLFYRTPLKELKSIYQFIETCYHEKQYSLSMSLANLQETVHAFPDKFLLFKVGTEDTVAAAAIVIQVSSKVLYTFYYAHQRRFNKISPVVFLIDGIYQYAQQHKFTHVDLGTSMINGGINTPLLHFKKSMGGRPSTRFIFEKVLS